MTTAVPSEDELAAITVAIEALWPRAVMSEEDIDVFNPWRFSGRWWARPVTARRARPWVPTGS